MSEKQSYRDADDMPTERAVLEREWKAMRLALSTPRAALAAQPGAVGEWKRVPVEPTADMMNAAMDCQDADPEDGLSGEIYATYKAMLAAAPTEAKPAQADALNTLCKMLHSGEEVEGDDGLSMLVPMDLWNEAQEAIELLVGEDEATEAKPAQDAVDAWTEEDMDSLCWSAFESAMAGGVSVDSFRWLANSLRAKQLPQRAAISAKKGQP